MSKSFSVIISCIKFDKSVPKINYTFHWDETVALKKAIDELEIKKLEIKAVEPKPPIGSFFNVGAISLGLGYVVFEIVKSLPSHDDPFGLTGVIPYIVSFLSN